MNAIPIDLIHEIFSRLPIKSIGRFHCVSDIWRSILYGPDFTELFITRSLARPRLLFVMQGFRINEWLFYSSPQAHREKSSLAKNFHLKLRGDMRVDFCGRASGLLCFFHWNGKDRVHVICNPSIGQCEFLPKLSTNTNNKSYLGFDPIDKIFKLVSMASRDAGHRIMSLGTGIMSWSWRKIQCPLTHHPRSKRICINGVLYYLARHKVSYLIVCFYVRSEQFKFVHAGFIDVHTTLLELINYKDKLGVIRFETGGSLTQDLRMWVLEDVEKQDWSEFAYTLPDHSLAENVYCHVSVVGVTATGEIVILKKYYTIPSRWLYVIYFHPERNTIQRVEMQGFVNRERVLTFVNHVDDLTFPLKPHPQEDRR